MVKLRNPATVEPVLPHKSLLSPGIFTGRYGPHGSEILHVTEYKNLLIGSKLTVSAQLFPCIITLSCVCNIIIQSQILSITFDCRVIAMYHMANTHLLLILINH